ncbi:MAG: biotin/lipoyl-binding protein [Myxococcota bacterium]
MRTPFAPLLVLSAGLAAIPAAAAAPAREPVLVLFGTMEVPKRQGGILRHRQDGQVAEVLVAPGDEVKLGQALLTYRDEAARRRLEAAQARFEALLAESDVDQAAMGAARDELKRAEQAVQALVLHAPAAGLVTDVSAAPGRTVRARDEAMCLLVPEKKTRVAHVVAQPQKGIRVEEGRTLRVRVGSDEIEATVQTVKHRRGQLELTLVLERAPAQDAKGPVGVRLDFTPLAQAKDGT